MRYRVVGNDEHWGEHVVLNVYEDVEKQTLHPALTNEGPIRPSLAARKGHSDEISGELLVTETDPGGMRIYGSFRRALCGTWYFSCGIVVSMQDGWYSQGSSNCHGVIVHDSGKMLDRLLDTTTQTDDLYQDHEIYPRRG
jgi:hypothetical protein